MYTTVYMGKGVYIGICFRQIRDIFRIILYNQALACHKLVTGPIRPYYFRLKTVGYLSRYP
jgi:hypothetical protein